MADERIPLFPLEVVLLPESVLPLHIFEPRYKEMIRRCLNEPLEFGVVQQREEGIVAVGCTAEITQTMKEYEDGRFDLLTYGRRPFRVRAVIEEKSYFEADVDFLADSPAGPRQQQSQLLAKYVELHKLIFGQDPPAQDPEDFESVAYAAAGELPLELDFKQALLETRSESERQSLLLDRIEKWIPLATHQQRIKKVAGGNGHGLH